MVGALGDSLALLGDDPGVKLAAFWVLDRDGVDGQIGTLGVLPAVSIGKGISASSGEDWKEPDSGGDCDGFWTPWVDRLLMDLLSGKY
jgi:hypothetical protein